MSQRRRSWPVWVGWYAAAYIGSAAALASSAFPSGFTPWYPPAGLTLAFLILGGPRAIPIAFAVRLLNTAIVFPEAWRDEADGVILRALAITACYAAAAWVLRRVGLRDAQLRELGWFAVVGVVAAPLAASLSVAVIEVLALESTAADAFDAAFTFWVGDAVAIVAIVPAALLVAAARSGFVRAPRLPVTRADRIETFLQSGTLVLVPVLAILISNRDGQTAYLILTVVPVIWVALRRDLVMAAVGLLLLNATLATVAAVSLEQDVAVTELQAVLLAAALAGLYIAAATHSQEMAVADLIESEERYRSVVGSAPDLVARFHPDGTLRYASEPPWLDDAGGSELVLADLQTRWADATAGIRAGDGVRSVEWEHHGENETRTYSARLAPEHRADGGLAGIIAVVTDLTPRRRAEAERAEAERRDRLTGLVNRSALLEALDTLDPTAITEQLAVLVVDIDQFKTINAVEGHHQGNEILCEVAARVAATVPDPLIAARVGGDEFALAFLTRAGMATAAVVAEQLLGELRSPLGRDHLERTLTASIGVAVGGAPGASAEDVFCDAESAMHAAKEAGRDRVAHFDADRRSVEADRRATEALLRMRLSQRSVVIHYQPVVHLATGALYAVEALARLRGDHDEIVMADRFIGLAEATGLDVELGTVVLEEVLAQMAAWPSDTLVAHVNVTARQLTRPGFATQVLEACTRAGVRPQRLCLELTETLVMVDPDAAIVALTELRAHGVGAALDDFGTGYSSIAYLSLLPVSDLKIDRAFVTGLPGDQRARALVGLVAGLGTALRLRVIAEGVETEEQRRCLLELGCEYGQGFLMARPAPPEEVTEMLELRTQLQ